MPTKQPILLRFYSPFVQRKSLNFHSDSFVLEFANRMRSLLELSFSSSSSSSSTTHRNHQRVRRRIPSNALASLLVTFWTWLLTMSYLAPGFEAKALPDIFWNSSNPIFRIDNTEHVFVVKIHDRVDFVCPFLAGPSPSQEPEVMEIYSVSKWSYDYCQLTQDSAVVGVCNNPFQRHYATVVFREYTPKPGGLEFKPGHSYYFISTSSGQPDGVQNKQGGLCSEKNMKVKFEVESNDLPDGSSGSKSVEGFPAAGGVAQTNAPPRKSDQDDGGGYDDDQYQMSSANGAGGGGQIEIDPSSSSGVNKPSNSIGGSSGSSRTHDNSRELKKNQQNASGGEQVTTPRMYEIHTRPEGDFVDVKRTDYREHYGSNAQHRRNSASSSWRLTTNWPTSTRFVFVLVVLLSSSFYSFYRNNNFEL